MIRVPYSEPQADDTVFFYEICNYGFRSLLFNRVGNMTFTSADVDIVTPQNQLIHSVTVVALSIPVACVSRV